MVNRGLMAPGPPPNFCGHRRRCSAATQPTSVSAMRAVTSPALRGDPPVPTYKAPVDNVLFLLNEVLGYPRHANLPGFAEAPAETVAAVLGEGGKFAEGVLAPLNRTGDSEGCRRDSDGSVRTPAGFKEAYARYAAGGWIGLAGDPAYGGQGLPFVLAAAMNEFVTSANMAFGMYPGLTQGAIAALTLHGSEAQKKLYLPKLMSGEWSGTMNLTEPQAGTD